MKQDDVKREEMKDMESMERELAAYEELRKEIENEIYMLPREIIVKMIGVIACLVLVVIWFVVYG